MGACVGTQNDYQATNKREIIYQEKTEKVEKVEEEEIECNEMLIGSLKLQKVSALQMKHEIHKNIVAIVWNEPTFQKMGRGSGILISNDLILTCAHIFYQDSQRQKKVNQRFISVYPGQYGKLMNPYKVQKIFIPRQFQIAPKNKTVQFDYALIKLKKKVPAQDFLPLNGYFTKKHNQKLAIYGYPDQKYSNSGINNIHSVQQWGLKLRNSVCQVRAEGQILYTISTLPGQSGSPIVYRVGKKYSVIGIHKGGKTANIQGESAQLNCGKLLNFQLIDKLKEEAANLNAEKFSMIEQNQQQQEDDEESIKELQMTIQQLESKKQKLSAAIEKEQEHLNAISKQKQELDRYVAMFSEKSTSPRNFQNMAKQNEKQRQQLSKTLIQMQKIQYKNTGLSQQFKKLAASLDKVCKEKQDLQKDLSLFFKSKLSQGEITAKLLKQKENIQRERSRLWNQTLMLKERLNQEKEENNNLQEYLRKIIRQNQQVARTQQQKLRSILNQKQQQIQKLIAQYAINNKEEEEEEEEEEEAEEQEEKEDVLLQILVFAQMMNGINLNKSKQYYQAIQHFEKVINLKPKYSKAYSQLGVAYCGLRNIEKATECCKRAIELEPQNTVAYCYLGIALYFQGKYEEAVTFYRKAIEINPQSYTAHYQLGLALKNNSQFEQAIYCFRRAIQIQSQTPQVVRNTGSTIIPQLSQVYSSLGNLFFDINREQQAIKCFVKTTELNPNDFQANLNLGNALYVIKRMDNAIDCYLKALKINENSTTVYYNLGLAFKAIGRIQKAIDYQQKAVDIDPEDPKLCFALGNSFLAMNYVEESIGCYLKAVELNPHDQWVFNNLGLAFYSLNRNNEAIQSYIKAININPYYSIVFYNLGVALFSVNRFDQATENYQKAIIIDPQFSKAYNNLGNTLRLLHKIEEATDCYQTMIKINPRDIKAYNNLGNAFIDIKQIQKAIDCYLKATQIDSYYPFSYNNLGYAFQQMNDFHKAIFYYHRANQLDRQNKIILANLNRVLNYFREANIVPEGFQRQFNSSQ